MERNKIKEEFILRTTELYSSAGIVHIRSIGYDNSEEMHIEWDAKSLLEDIPSLYTMAKQALKQDKEHEYKKYLKFIDEINNDLKK